MNEFTPATTNDEAVTMLERLGRNLAKRGGMTAGYVNVHVGAGNPKCFFTVVYQHDGYGSDGSATTAKPAIWADGATLIEAVNKVAEIVIGEGRTFGHPGEHL